MTERRLIVRGHAGQAEKGMDIVCAAASVLTLTMLKSLNALTQSRILYTISDGYVDIVFENLLESGKLLVDSFFLGICALIEEYPECIKLAP